MVHLGDLVVQLDEARGSLLTCKRDKTVFYYRAFGGLSHTVSTGLLRGGCGVAGIVTDLWVIDADDDDGVWGDLLDGIEVPCGIDGVDGAIPSLARTDSTSSLVLKLLHARLSPLAHEPLVLVAVLRVTGTGATTYVVAVTAVLALLLVSGVGLSPGERVAVVECAGRGQGASERALLRTLKGLCIGDDALGPRVGVVDGRRDVVCSWLGDHGAGEVDLALV